MSVKKAVVFVDGENLVMRFQEMIGGARALQPHVIFRRNCFVWSPLIFQPGELDLVRVNYYTHVVGDDQKVQEITELIATTNISQHHHTHLNPRVHKKSKQSNKTKVVDVDITMDVMRAALTMPIDAIVLLSGDGDYVPLVQEVARSTSKQVFVGALSSGLAEPLKSCGERFMPLDDDFFKTLEETAPPATTTAPTAR